MRHQEIGVSLGRQGIEIPDLVSMISTDPEGTDLTADASGTTGAAESAEGPDPLETTEAEIATMIETEKEAEITGLKEAAKVENAMKSRETTEESAIGARKTSERRS